MASGCPVITSNDTGCAETAGNAAVLVDPRSVEEIAAAMRRLMDEHGLSNALKKKGLARASRFTWRKSAEELVQVMPLRR
jgi:glycosyltransferase involved in cell wall biosynthesis